MGMDNIVLALPGMLRTWHRVGRSLSRTWRISPGGRYGESHPGCTLRPLREELPEGALLATVTFAPRFAWAEASPATKAAGPPQDASMLMVTWSTRTNQFPRSFAPGPRGHDGLSPRPVTCPRTADDVPGRKEASLSMSSRFSRNHWMVDSMPSSKLVRGS